MKISFFLKLATFFLIFSIGIEKCFSQTVNLDWLSRIGGSTSDNGYVITTDPATNDIYIAGTFTGTVDINPDPSTVKSITAIGGSDIFYIKLNSAGECQWAQQMGGTGNETVTSILYNAGYIYIMAHFTNTTSVWGNTTTSGGGTDVILARFVASTGAFNWVEHSLQSVNDVSAYNMVADGTYLYITGGFSNAYFDPGMGAIADFQYAGGDGFYIQKRNLSNGDYVAHWTMTGGGAQGRSIKINSAGEFVVSGNFKSTIDFDPGAGTANLTAPTTLFNSFIAIYSSSIVYQGAYQISSTGEVYNLDMDIDNADNIFITGYIGNSVTADFDPGAGTANLTSVGGWDCYLAKYNSSGIYQWANSFGSIWDETGNSIDVDGSNIYITGMFGSTTDFDPSGSTANLTAIGFGDAFLAHYDNSGNYVVAERIAGVASGYCAANAIAINNGKMVVAGYFNGSSIDFDPVGTTTLTSAGSKDAFMAQYSIPSIDLSGVGYHVANGQITGTTTEMEYSLNSTNGSDGTWTSCMATTTTGVNYAYGGFDVWVREIAIPSNNSNLGTVATRASGPVYTINYSAETTMQTVPSTDEYSTSSNMSGSSSGTGVPISLTPGTTLYFRTKATATTVNSTIEKLIVPSRKSRPSVEVSDANSAYASLIGANTNMEYNYNSSGFISVTGDERFDLYGPNTLVVRYKATGSAFASEQTPDLDIIDDMTASGSGNWSSVLSGAIASSNITIPSGSSVIVDGATACANLTIEAGGSITVPAGKTTLSIGGDLILGSGSEFTNEGTTDITGNLTINSDATGTGSLVDKGTITVGGTST
ncbi:MAG: hypothetical protein GXO79_11225, partial [Chlorobi bacterium]|nr:hypothetical protein [Chlorobiota bacterium]